MGDSAELRSALVSGSPDHFVSYTISATRHSPGLQEKSPQLGDFSSLDFYSLAFQERETLSSLKSFQTPSKEPTAISERPLLGDFSRLTSCLPFEKALQQAPVLADAGEVAESPLEPFSQPSSTFADAETSRVTLKSLFGNTRSGKITKLGDGLRGLASDLANSSEPEPDLEFDSDSGLSSASNIPCTPPQDSAISWSQKHRKPYVSAPKPVYRWRLGSEEPKTVKQKNIEFFKAETSRDRMGQDLLDQLVVRDSEIQQQNPDMCDRGIHVFLDQSNIQIGFVQTWLAAHGLPKNAHVSPMPQMSVRALNDIVGRGRVHKTLSSCCSTQNNGRQPEWGFDLLAHKWTVEVRERKALGDGTHKEDRVDETLQEQMRETLAKQTATSTTFIVITGDGKPAEHSPGFVACVKDILAAGHYVEVVNWNLSCSQAWKDLAADEEYGDHFRHYYLNNFLQALCS
ncbi:uncharacterized protein F5Z01DRAFT_260613 [Emericellopsis atlantica]|uniref:NYN domain-containing protein n=1 Tax=Emericellopsis atlantica TaxID=2614577 RepID=A0A9P7ZGF2_9HYPO|nr:uncharacterized protein F5Z01DRAFT_260613 [Emericellopsis atlantica]KAG9251678.1 hypothetical protein F5Z01DRAFT_260613 [Emericellopsis atlantica]